MSMRPALLLGLATLLPLFLPGRAWPQSEASQEGQRERDVPVFRTGVNTVVVDALVLDDDGNPVSDLTREDFEVLEDGVPQRITTFDVTDWTSYVGQQSGSGSTAGAANVNLHPRRFILILNRQGAQFMYLARAKRALSSFVVESLADGDEAMVIDIGYATKVIQEFQPHKETTLEAIRTLSQMQMDYPIDPYRASQQIYGDLESIAESLAEVPGRKILVFMSPELATFARVGTRAADQGFAMKRAIDALNQANASVYTIDLYGADGGGSSAYGGLSPLASETGGRFFKNTVSFEPVLRRIGRENQRYYLLGYTPATEPDGTFRKIDVRVSRADVEVVARSGYYAREPEAVATADAGDGEDGADDDGAERAEAAEDAPDFPLAVELTTYLLPTGTGPVRVAISVALPEELLTGERGASMMELRVNDGGGDGETVHRFEEDVSAEQYYVLRSVDLPPGPYLISLALRSGDHEVYRSSTGLEIPRDFGQRFGLSSIIPIVSPDAVAAVEATELPIRPTPTTPHGEDTFVLFQVFPGAESPSTRVRVTFNVYDASDRSLREGGPDRPIELGTRPGGTPVILSVPTRALDYGTYRIEIRVQDEARSRRAASEIQIRIR